MTPWPLEEERELWRSICRDSFWWFLRIAFGADAYMRHNPNDRWLTSRLHRPICDWLEARVREWESNRSAHIKRRLKVALIIPRSFGKTVIGTKCLSMWAQLRHPDISSFIGSEIVSRAVDFLRPIKSIYSGDDPHSWFTWLYGKWYNPEREWSAYSIVHGARHSVARSEPSWGTWGVESGITGDHPDWGVLDDPLSEDKIRESGQWIAVVNQSVAALRPAFRTDSFFLLSLTRYRDNDVVGSFIATEGVRSWIGMPSSDDRFRVREDGEWDVYYLQALDGSGNSIFPEVWSTGELKKYEATRPVEFAAQMMNEPGSGEHMPLTSEQISQMWIDRDELPSQMAITIHTDTAFKKKETLAAGDESVIEVWGHDPRGNGDVYFLEGISSHQWRIEDFTDELVRICQRLKKEGKRVKCITGDREMGGYQGAWENWLRSSFHGAGLVQPPFIALSRAGIRKSIRIRESAGFWVDGHVKLTRAAPGVDKLINQMVRIGISSHDDWADAAADVFAPDVYRPMLNPSITGREEGGIPMQPGDYELGRHWGTPSNDDLRQIYDWEHGEYMMQRFEEDDFAR